MSGVYPRVCGGNTGRQSTGTTDEGLSPRVRGKRLPMFDADALQGSIPACAGETNCLMCDNGLAGVYPRVCGGNGRPS